MGVNYHTANGGEIYVGTGTGSGGALNKDAFTAVFSHELAEAMASAVTVTDPGHFNLGNQICDNEPEVNGYYVNLAGSYPGPGGSPVATTNLVQAYWSQKDGAFIVPTGGAGAVRPKLPVRPNGRRRPVGGR
jgi:hypothetical protein